MTASPEIVVAVLLAASFAPSTPVPRTRSAGVPTSRSAAVAAPARTAGALPKVLNVVHHKLKRRVPAGYQTLEASIVAAYERAKVPMFWITLQSKNDPRDILYLNVADTAEQFNHLAEVYRSAVQAHPELARMSERLAKMIDTQSSTLTTRRDEVEFGRTDVDFASMHALLLTTFHVKSGHEGKFMDAVRIASGGGAPWVVYEANDDSTFILAAPLRSRADAKRGAPIPRTVRELRGVYRSVETQAYVLSPEMSHFPVEFRSAALRSTAPKPKPH